MSSSFYVQFQGFQPSPEAQAHIDSLLRELYEEAPYDSNLRAVFIRKKDVFKGVVRLMSSAGPFFAVASSGDLRDVSNKLFDRTKRRLDKWKSKRFRARRKHPVFESFPESA